MPARNIVKRAAVLLLLLIALPLMLRWFEHYQVYHPSRTFLSSGSDLGVPFEDVDFAGAGTLKLNGWFFPATTNQSDRRRVVVLCHGNGGNISHRLDVCAALLEAGLAVFVFDYRGYGRSAGRPSEEGTYQDAQAAYRWVRHKGYEPEDILAYGESLGGAVACELAARERCGGLVLQSTFTSIPDIGAELFPWLPVRWIARIQYDTCRKLPNLKLPVLMMHSRADELIGFGHCEKNFSAAGVPKLLCEIGGGHNDPLADRGAFLAGLRKFLQLLPTTTAAD